MNENKNKNKKIKLLGNTNDIVSEARTESSGSSYAYKVNLAFNLEFQETLETILNLVKKEGENPEKLKQAADKLVKLVNDFKSDTTQLKSSIDRVNNTTLPELEERIEAKLNDNLSIYLNELNIVKKEISNSIDPKTKQEQIDQLCVHQAYNPPQIVNTLFPHYDENILMKICLLMTHNTTFLSDQNKAILNQTEYLKEQLKFLQTQNKELLTENNEIKDTLNELKDYKNNLLNEAAEKEKKRLARLNRKKKQKLDPITVEDYNFIINYITQHNALKEAKKARFRVLSCLLLLTGCRISEILEIKASIIVQLFTYNYIEIQRKKRGKKVHKAYISASGKKLFNQIKNDIVELFVQGGIKIDFLDPHALTKLKLNDEYLFQNATTKSHLTRETFTREYNHLLNTISNAYDKNVIFRSHSFRAGYITQLWKNSHDIELVRQVIGHSNIQSTITYTQDLSPKELETKVHEFDPLSQNNEY